MYTPPAGNAVNFDFTGLYTAPIGTALVFNFNPLAANQYSVNNRWFLI
jgi:hypothetical protein